MRSNNKILKANGGQFVDSGDTLTGKDIYLLEVLENATFTVLKEVNNLSETPVNVISKRNLAGKLVPTGAEITPGKNFFSDVTISVGKLWVYFDSEK